MLRPTKSRIRNTFTVPVPFPVTVVNNSQSTQDVHITIKGIDASITNNTKQQFYDLVNKTWKNSEVSVLLSSLPASTNPKGNIISIPHIDSGIVYLSFGPKAIIFNGIMPPDFANPSDPSFNITYDKFEISFLKSDGFPYIDITNVDFFCVPLQLEETLSGGTMNGPKGFSSDQSTVFKSFKNGLVHNKWNSIIQEINTSGNTMKMLRVVAPNKALVAKPPISNNFDATFFQTYVDHVWSFYKKGSGKTIKVDMTEISAANPKYKDVVFEGLVDNGEFVFSGNDAQGNPLPKISFKKPTGSIQIKNSIFGCANLFDAPNNTPQSVPAKNLGAAFNVGILAHAKITDSTLFLMPPTASRKASPQGKSWLTYKSNFYSNTITVSGNTIECYNVYAAIIHKNAINGDDYAFAFDDVTQSDSTLAANNATGAIVTIQKLA